MCWLTYQNGNKKKFKWRQVYIWRKRRLFCNCKEQRTIDRNDISLREGTEQRQSVNLLFSANAKHYEVQVGKGRFTHSMPRPCRAAKGLECVFPIWFTKCGRVWFTLVMPGTFHPRPCRSSQGHGTERPSRDGLWTTCSRSASFGYHVEFHEGSYQTHTNLRCRWPVWNQTPFAWTRKRVVAAHYKKDDLLRCWTSSSDISGYHSRRTWHCRSRAGARHGMCELTHGMAGERHGRGMLCVNRP